MLRNLVWLHTTNWSCRWRFQIQRKPRYEARHFRWSLVLGPRLIHSETESWKWVSDLRLLPPTTVVNLFTASCHSGLGGYPRVDWVCPEGGYVQGWMARGRSQTWDRGRGWVLSPLPGHGTWDADHPLVLTPSLGRQNTYGWQAGGTHPTGCFLVCTTYQYTFSSVLSNVE